MTNKQIIVTTKRTDPPLTRTDNPLKNAILGRSEYFAFFMANKPRPKPNPPTKIVSAQVISEIGDANKRLNKSFRSLNILPATMNQITGESAPISATPEQIADKQSK